ncbi:MAG: phosphatidylglycerophosphate synthase [Lysobacterales bacterium]|jgi:cardiolipin synthase|nr:MAG: phosphatidylglycerophosphate synthase [Xanthomonadales bacterium]
MSSLRLIWIPNAITLIRLLLAWPLYQALDAGHFARAAVIAAVAGLSDVLDGWLAKRYGWVTRLGGMLDPIADKLLVLAAFVGLHGAGLLPAWLLMLVVGRDLIIVLGAIAYRLLIGPFEPEPTKSGKITTFAQLSLLVWLLLSASLWPLPEAGTRLMMILVALLTFLSGLHYVWIWSGRACASRRARPA